MGAVVGPRVVSLSSVAAVDLPGGSWSRMLITSGSVAGNRCSLGCSVFRPGTVVSPVSHATEEVAYVVSGVGELRLDGGALPFQPGDALHIPAGVWHAVANTGPEDVLMVFGFPHPDYPPTERRS
jgi:quercetin dioxygenase-like cupin family protein